MAVTEERCGLTELPVDQCAHCRPAAPEPPRDPASFGPWFEARFESDCDGDCGGVIEEGDSCRADGEGGYLCQVCGADE
jgi:hypothetical protein